MIDLRAVMATGEEGGKAYQSRVRALLKGDDDE